MIKENDKRNIVDAVRTFFNQDDRQMVITGDVMVKPMIDGAFKLYLRGNPLVMDIAGSIMFSPSSKASEEELDEVADLLKEEFGCVHEKKIKALRLVPWLGPEVINIDNSLRALQSEVEGPIETVFFDGGAFIVNENGKMAKLPANFTLYGQNTPIDILVGTVLVVGVKTSADGMKDFCSLTDEQIKELKEKYSLENRQKSVLEYLVKLHDMI